MFPTDSRPIQQPRFPLSFQDIFPVPFSSSSQNTPRARKSFGCLLFLPKRDLLGAPLEAQVFRYTAAVAGSFWAWLAVLAAALGICCIRIHFPRPSAYQASGSPGSYSSRSAPPSSPALAEPSPRGQLGGNTTPKALFIEYCHADDGSDEKERGDGEATNEEEEATWGWERRIVRKRGHLGCCRYDDRAAFNGSMYRLWEGNAELTAEAGVEWELMERN